MSKMLIATTLISLLFTACSPVSGFGPNMMNAETTPETKFENDNFDSVPSSILSYQMGPFDLLSGSKSNFENPFISYFKTNEPFWFSSLSLSIEDANGNSIPNELISQIIFLNHGEENRICNESNNGNPFAAITGNLKDNVLPAGFGYLLLPTDQLEARAVLRNSTDADYKNVYIHFSIHGEIASENKIVTDVFPIMIGNDPCSFVPLEISPGQILEDAVSYGAPEKGKIIKAYGLLQTFGVSVELSKNDSVPFWEGMAIIDESYKIIDLPPFEDISGIDIQDGDQINSHITYNNMGNTWFSDATASAILYIARDENASFDAVTAQKNLF